MTHRDQTFPRCNAFAGLIDNSAATDAANRLYQEHDEGMRFYCDSGERISPEEARMRDARDAARRGTSKPEPDYLEELVTSEAEFLRGTPDVEDEFDPVLDSEPDDDYEIDLEDLDIAATADDDAMGILELLD